MCFDSGGEPITYEQLMPPEALEYRKGLYDFMDLNQYGTRIESYPGQLPFTGGPDMGQLAGINTILALMGYPAYQGQGMAPNTLGPDYQPAGSDEQASAQPGNITPHPGIIKPDKDPYAPKRVRRT